MYFSYMDVLAHQTSSAGDSLQCVSFQSDYIWITLAMKKNFLCVSSAFKKSS